MRNASPRARRGFSVVEVIVAIVLLGVALSSLGVLAFGASRRSRTTGAATYRAAIVNEISDRYEALPWTELLTQQNYDSTISTGPMPHRRIVTIATPTDVRKEVMIEVRPLNPLVAPEIVLVKRYRVSDQNPLFMSTP